MLALITAVLAAGPLFIAEAEETEPLCPEEAITLAQEHSRELEIARIRQAAEVRTHQLAVRRFLPRFSLSLSGNDAVSIGKPDTRMKRFTLTITQPVLNGGKIAAERSSSRHRLELNRRLLENRKHELADAVWTLYHRILLLKQTLTLRKESLALAEAEQTVMRKSHQLGEITELDLIGTELSVNGLAADMAETEAELEKALFSMKKLLGIDPALPLILEGKLDGAYRGIEIHRPPDFYYRLALKNNYAIAAKSAAAREKSSAYRISKRSWLPSVDIEGSLFIQGEQFPLQRPGFTITVSLSAPTPVVPITARFSGGSEGPGQVNRGLGFDTTIAESITWYPDMKKNQLAAASARLELEEAQADLEFQISTAVAAYGRKKQRTELSRRELILRRRQLAVLREKLRMGEVRRSDYVEADIKTAESEIALLERVLGLIEEERKIEKLAGLAPGELKVYEEGR